MLEVSLTQKTQNHVEIKNMTENVFLILAQM